MIVDGYEFMIDCASKFFNTVRVAGWFKHPSDRLESVALEDDSLIESVCKVEESRSGGFFRRQRTSKFSLQCLRRTDTLNGDVRVVFTTSRGWKTSVPLAELCNDRRSRYASHAMHTQFIEAVNSRPGAKVLDVGGRARSRVDRRRQFPEAEVTVLDVLPGENVDVVADAHTLADHFDESTFDFIYSFAVFEHLLMPWAVVAQINKVLKPGALGLVYTHQTLGMHDLPWDFWRFSDTAWSGLFNRHTGFEIVETALDSTQFVIPFIFTPDKQIAERSAGFEASMVSFRKVGPCKMQWPLSCADVIATQYPSGTN